MAESHTPVPAAMDPDGRGPAEFETWWSRFRVGVARFRTRFGPDPDTILLNTRNRPERLLWPSLMHLCDWSLSDYGFHGDPSRQPRTVFVKPRHRYLRAFFTRYLPRIATGTRFVLITGSGDLTVPRQVDRRFESFEGTDLAAWFAALRADPRLVRWYGDNVDLEGAGIEPIPCGAAGPWGGCPSWRIADYLRPVRLDDRPLRATCLQRVRQGPQWELRRRVAGLATTRWRGIVDVLDPVPVGEFFATVRRYPFTICASGGGLDPSPKAWAAMLAGSIPIIERNPMAAAYRELPVAVVDSWSEGCITRERLEAWRSELAPHYEDAGLRRQVLARMSMGHWWRKVRADLGDDGGSRG